MVDLFAEHKLDYQLAASGDHRLIPTESAIQTCENHAITVNSDMDPNFQKRAWHHALNQIIIRLNML